MNDVRFPYKPKSFVLLLSSTFFVACASISGYIALTNDRGLILNNIFEFSTEGATIFYWCLTATSCVFVIIGAIALYSGLTTKKEIVLTDNKIMSPKSGISNKIVSILYSEITDVNIQSVQKQRFLNILHSGGTLSIPQSMLTNKQAFEELTSLVAVRVGA